jgi:hypothetical protein
VSEARAGEWRPQPGANRPLSSTPDRAPGSARRSSHVDIILTPADPQADPGAASIVLRAGAQEVVTGAEHSEVVASGSLRAWISPERRVERIEVDPDLEGVDQLIGIAAGRGFRKVATAIAGERLREPVGQLLDDVPVATLIAGYAMLRAPERFPSAQPRGPITVVSDVCSGWRTGGVLHDSVDAGHGVPIAHLAPALTITRADDPLAFETHDALPKGALRRRRRIDVGPGDQPAIDAMFRDSFVDSDGNEGVLHEYAVHAQVDEEGRLLSVVADPRVLPFIECPAAAGNVARLVGTPTGELGSVVGEVLTGIDACTHLNDLLRSLRAVPRLMALRSP